MLEPGNQIDIWVVERALGAGGMGSVYRCHNRTASRILAAVKVLEGSLRTHPEAEARFIREAEILFQLDHPGIVKVRNVRTDMDPPYLEMEFVEGESLEDRLQQGPLPFREALAHMEQIASAMAYLHGKGVRHRDIKPANLLVNRQGRVKLVDFGLAMEADNSRITQQGMAFGTVSYAPPEWINPDTLDPSQWDIYAAGVVFYEMLTGKLAFPVSGQGSARQQAMQVIVGKQSAPALDPGSEFPEDVRALVRAMTEPVPEDRIRSAVDVLHRIVALKGALPHSPGVTLAPESMDNFDWDPTSEEAPPPAVEPPPPALPPIPPSPNAVTAPAPPPRTARAPDAGSRGRSGVLALLVAGTVLLSLVAVASLAGGLALRALAPSERAVEVVVTGLPSGTDAAVRLGERRAASTDGWVSTFDAVPTGAAEITWVMGPDCPLDACPGPGCPTWCGTGTHELEVVEGEGPQTMALALEPPAGRTVKVEVPELGDASDGTFALGSTEGTYADGAVVFEGVQPGPAELHLSVGSCAEADAGCWPDGACPEGCTSYRAELEVPWGSDPFGTEVALPAPARPAPAPTPQPAVAAVRPTPEPAPAASGGSGTPVTNARFAKWLEANADWQPEAAVSAGRADAGYLSGWTGAQPPAGKSGSAVVNVSWYAGAAYCKGRGGLATVDAEPNRWDESAATPYMEWRTADGRAAWRSNDGRSGTKGISLKSLNGFTTIRCAR